MIIERERPSKLDETLEAFKNPVSGVIEISPKAARTVLLERLLAFYHATVEKPSDKVEVLSQIAGEGDGLVNFTKALRKFQEDQREKQEFIEKIKVDINVIKGRRQHPEI